MTRVREVLAFGVVLMIFGAVFWPGLYRYDESKLGTTTLVMRTNRLTQRSEILMGAEWQPVADSKTQIAASRELPSEELAKIRGTRETIRGGRFEMKLYNGSEWTVTELQLKLAMVDVKDSAGKTITNPFMLLDLTGTNSTADYAKRRADTTVQVLWEREYKKDVVILPLSTSDAELDVLDYVEGQPILWTIVGGTGTPPKKY